jgi:hypothetical protein
MSDDAMREERDFNERNIEEFRRNGGKVGGQFLPQTDPGDQVDQGPWWIGRTWWARRTRSPLGFSLRGQGRNSSQLSGC